VSAEINVEIVKNGQAGVNVQVQDLLGDISCYRIAKNLAINVVLL